LEELGKLFCVDGLLFARVDDYKSASYAKSLRSHSVKLSALTMLPMFLGILAEGDSRYESDQNFKEALLLAFTDLKARGNRVFALLKDSSFQDLDVLKQSGFYAQPNGNVFVCPADNVTKELAEAVHLLAWRATTTLDFLMKDGGMERYIGRARDIRAKLREEDHRQLEQLGLRVTEEIFRDLASNDDERIGLPEQKRDTKQFS
jgi:AbiV family abortive infection protein